MKNSFLNNSKNLFATLIVLVAVNWLGSIYFSRFDLTQDKRFTLSQTTLNIIKTVDKPLIIDVFLEGNYPPEFKRLQTETKQLLEEFSAYNSNIIVGFTNPIEDESTQVETMQEFYKNGMQPLSITVEDKGKQSQEVVFPWAIANFEQQTTKVALLKNFMGASTDQKVKSSVQHLEFAFAEAIQKITVPKAKKIAIIKGNGELLDPFLFDFVNGIRESYFIGQFTLDSVSSQPQKTAKELREFDLAIIAKPTQDFSEQEKQVLDQYIINGGKTLWMLDAVKADMDSLYNENGAMYSFAQTLNLNDFFFKYGIRMNPLLIKDEIATPIKLASGNLGRETQYETYMWKYAPFVYPSTNHPIVKNIEGVKFDFTSPIELLENKEITKTPLLQTSEYSKTVATPAQITLDEIGEEAVPDEYKNGGKFNVAVLLEGPFTSVYKNRILPFKTSDFKEKGVLNKMIIISDGDVIKNQINKGQPLELGYDKWTNSLFGNKEFLNNCVNYLLDDNGLINIRSKEVKLALLDKQKIHTDYTSIQLFLVGLPLIVLLLFGLVFNYNRKRKYARKTNI